MTFLKMSKAEYIPCLVEYGSSALYQHYSPFLLQWFIYIDMDN